MGGLMAIADDSDAMCCGCMALRLLLEVPLGEMVLLIERAD